MGLRDIHRTGRGKGNGPRRVDKRTKLEQQNDFLKSYIECGIVIQACYETNLCPSSVQMWKMNDPVFVQSMEFCKGVVCTKMEDEAYRRAVKGVEKPVWQNGKRVGEITEYSDTLLIFLMKGNMPQKYRDKLEINKGAPGQQDSSILILPSNGRELLEETIKLPTTAFSTVDPNNPIPEIFLKRMEEEIEEEGEATPEDGIDFEELDSQYGD